MSVMIPGTNEHLQCLRIFIKPRSNDFHNIIDMYLNTEKFLWKTTENDKIWIVEFLIQIVSRSW